MSFHTCLPAASSLVSDDVRTLHEVANDYIQRGMKRPEAEKQAVKDLIELYQKEYDSINKQVMDQISAKQPKQEVTPVSEKKLTRAAEDWNDNFALQEDGSSFTYDMLDAKSKREWKIITEQGGAHTQDQADALIKKQQERTTPKSETQPTTEKQVVNEPTQQAPTLKEAIAEAETPKTPAPSLRKARNAPKSIEDLTAQQKEIQDAKYQLRLRTQQIQFNKDVYTPEQRIEAYKALKHIAGIIGDPLSFDYKKVLKDTEQFAHPEKIEKPKGPLYGNAKENNISPLTPHTVESLKATLSQKFGTENIDRAIKIGKLVLHETPKDLPKDVRQEVYGRRGNTGDVGTWAPENAYGWYTGEPEGKGAVHLVANNIDVNDSAGRIMHEIGVHAGMPKMLGSGYTSIVRELRAIQDRVANNEPQTPIEKLVKAASNRITDGTPEINKPHELIAYFVEEGYKQKTQLPLWKRIVTALKGFAYKHGFVFRVDTYTGMEAIKNLAEGAANEWIGNTRLPPNDGGGKKSPESSTAIKDVLAKYSPEIVKYAEAKNENPDWNTVAKSVRTGLYKRLDQVKAEVPPPDEAPVETTGRTRELTRLRGQIADIDMAMRAQAQYGIDKNRKYIYDIYSAGGKFLGTKELTNDEVRVIKDKGQEAIYKSTPKHVMSMAGELQPSSVRLATHMDDMEKLASDDTYMDKVRSMNMGIRAEGYQHSELHRYFANLLQKTELGSKLYDVGEKAMAYGHNFWEQLAVPANETFNKNYYGRRLKEWLLEHDSITNNAKANYTKFIGDMLPLSMIPFSRDIKYKEAAKQGSVLIRVISDDMQGVVSHNPVLADQFAKVVKNIVGSMRKEVDIETVFEKLQDSPEVKSLSELFWKTALDRQPDLAKGKVRAQYWRLDDENKPQPAETTIHDFNYSQEAVETAKKAHELVVLSALESAIADQHNHKIHTEALANDVGNKLYFKKPSNERKALREVVDKYHEVYAENPDTARQLLAGIQKHLTEQEQGKDTKFVPAENDQAYIGMKATIDKLTRNLTSEQRGALKTRIGNLLQSTAAARVEAAGHMQRSIDAISQFYVAHQRQSKNRVYSRLVDENGKPVQVNFDQYPAFVMGFDTYEKAKDFADWANNDKDMGNVWFDVKDRGGEDKKAKLVMEPIRNDYEDSARSNSPWFDLYTFTSQLRRSGVNLTAVQREHLIKVLAKRTDNQLKALRYRAAKGADQDIWRAFAGYLNRNAYIIGINYTRHNIDDLLYKHSWAPYEIERELDATKLLEPGPEKDALVKDLQEGLIVTRENSEYANNIQDLAKSIMSHYRSEAGHTPNIIDKTMHHAATSYLIANVGTAVNQIMSLPILIIPYCGSKKAKTGFGGGYGYANATKELSRSVATIAKMHAFLNPGSYTKPFSEVLSDRIAKTNLNSRDRLMWNYISREVKEGKLQIGQVMSVTNMYWNGANQSSRKVGKYVDMFMKPFALSEAYIRTASWMTAYNLAFNALSKAEQQRLTNLGTAAYADPVFKTLARAGDDAVEHTQGIYSQWARAPWLQNGWARGAAMFMHYPLVQLQLIKAMPLAGQAMYLGLMTALAGADGLPFKEDIQNIIDAFTRRFPQAFGRLGSKAFSGNIKDWYVGLTNDLLGEAGGELLRKGLLTNMTGMDVSSKLGFNNFVRGLDSGQYGNKFALLGPVGGFLDGAITSMGSMGDAAMALASGDDPTPFLMRTAKTLPITAIRNIANGVLMADTGEMRTRMGETVAQNMDMWDSFHQFLGWRPIEGVEQYALRDRQQVYKDIQTSLGKSYNNQLGLAKAEGDAEQFAQLRQDMDELTSIYRDAGIPIALKYNANAVDEIAKSSRQTLTEREMHKLPKQMQQYFGNDVQELSAEEATQ